MYHELPFVPIFQTSRVFSRERVITHAYDHHQSLNHDNTTVAADTTVTTTTLVTAR